MITRNSTNTYKVQLRIGKMRLTNAVTENNEEIRTAGSHVRSSSLTYHLFLYIILGFPIDRLSMDQWPLKPLWTPRSCAYIVLIDNLCIHITTIQYRRVSSDIHIH